MYRFRDSWLRKEGRGKREIRIRGIREEDSGGVRDGGRGEEV